MNDSKKNEDYLSDAMDFAAAYLGVMESMGCDDGRDRLIAAGIVRKAASSWLNGHSVAGPTVDVTINATAHDDEEPMVTVPECLSGDHPDFFIHVEES